MCDLRTKALDRLINVAIWRAGEVLHVLNRVQAVEDVTTIIVEELVFVHLLVTNQASGPVHLMKHAACEHVQNQSIRERTYKQTNSQRKSNTALWHCS